MFFSLIAVASAAPNCTLLPWWIPSTLQDWHSLTGYSNTQATYTQSCSQLVGTITCVSWTVVNGNTYKYPSCTPHTWANCTSPVSANHLAYKILYKIGQATPTFSCQQASQNFQCINWAFTGFQVNQYSFGSCTSQNRNQCINTRTNTYVNNGQSITAYTGSQVPAGQMCHSITLTCINWTWSGWNQASLYPICSSLAAPTWVTPTWVTPTCTNPINNATAYSGQIISAYTAPHVNIGQSCNSVAISMTCSSNGNRLGWSSGTPLYTWCTPLSALSCTNTRTNTWVANWDFVVWYTQSIIGANASCSSFKHNIYCQNGQWTWWAAWTGVWPMMWLHPTCSVGTWLSCTFAGGMKLDGDTWIWWSIPTATRPKLCSSFQTSLSCVNGIITGNYQTYQYSVCTGLNQLVPGVDLTLDESVWLLGGGNDIAQWSTPTLSLLIKNHGDTAVNESNLPAGFLSCEWTDQNIEIYSSNTIDTLAVNAGTQMSINISLKSIFAQALGTKNVTCTLDTAWAGIQDADTTNNVWSATFGVVKWTRFDAALNRSISSIQGNLDSAEGAVGTEGVKNLVFDKLMNVLVPLIIIIGILIAIIGFYKLMFSTDDKAVSEGTKYVIFGVVGIIVIVSARFIGNTIFDILNPTTGGIQWYLVAQDLYEKILFPFLKFAIFLVLWAMFIILLTRVITFIFGTSDDAQKKAWTLIGRNVIGMLIIIWAKQIVEAVYGKQADVVKSVTNLWEIWSGILKDKNIPILYQVINWTLGLTSLILLVLIIVQTIKLLMKPDDPNQMKSIKNTLVYMLIGIVIIGTWYLITNFAILN